MKLSLNHLVISFAIILLESSMSIAQATQCPACDHVEKSGDDKLEELKKMPLTELSKKDKDGATPFFWSVFHGQNQTRDFLLATLKKEELVLEEKASELYSRCANEQGCPAENLELLHKLGFKIANNALAASVTGTQECSLEKFELLKKFGAPLDAKDGNGYNLLHQIVDRSRMGRPKFSRECLVSALKVVIAERPELKKQKNKDNQTPLQLAKHFRRSKGEWGSGITVKDIDPIVRALR